MGARIRFSSLGTLAGKASAARATNDEGQVIGRSQVVGGRAFRRQDGKLLGLGTLPGWPHSSAIGPNELRDLGTLGGEHSIPFAINESGQLVGQSETTNGQ